MSVLRPPAPALAYAGAVVTHPLPLALLGATTHPVAGLTLALVAVATRGFAAASVDRLAGERTAPLWWLHARDLHDAPLDPNFTGTGRTVTDADGWYQFQTIKPGAYPWGNHHNAWRPAHIHFSLFGPSVLTRLVTQMYFPGDPLLEYDPIYNCVPDTSAKQRLIARFDLEKTIPSYALGYRWDIVLRGRDATPMEK